MPYIMSKSPGIGIRENPESRAWIWAPSSPEEEEDEDNVLHGDSEGVVDVVEYVTPN